MTLINKLKEGLSLRNSWCDAIQKRLSSCMLSINVTIKIYKTVYLYNRHYPRPLHSIAVLPKPFSTATQFLERQSVATHIALLGKKKSNSKKKKYFYLLLNIILRRILRASFFIRF
jgi:hypothetical protein